MKSLYSPSDFELHKALSRLRTCAHCFRQEIKTFTMYIYIERERETDGIHLLDMNFKKQNRVSVCLHFAI